MCEFVFFNSLQIAETPSIEDLTSVSSMVATTLVQVDLHCTTSL